MLLCLFMSLHLFRSRRSKLGPQTQRRQLVQSLPSMELVMQSNGDPAELRELSNHGLSDKQFFTLRSCRKPKPADPRNKANRLQLRHKRDMTEDAFSLKWQKKQVNRTRFTCTVHQKQFKLTDIVGQMSSMYVSIARIFMLFTTYNTRRLINNHAYQSMSSNRLPYNQTTELRAGSVYQARTLPAN